VNWLDLFATAGAMTAGALGLTAAGHALLNKRSSRAAFGWIGLALSLPLAGALLYYLFGINRSRRRARRLREEAAPTPVPEATGTAVAGREALARLGDNLSREALMGGNGIRMLVNGETAFPAMLEAIDRARRQILLSTYIFDDDAMGRRFVDGLRRAVARGVAVHVLLDGVGELYSLPPIGRRLRRAGVPFRRFLPPRLIPPSVLLNLRNHRKLLLVDGERGFTGGMNLSDRHLTGDPRNRRPVADLHFEVAGPIVTSLARVFRNDWLLTGGSLEAPGAPPGPVGSALCRTVADGPEESLDRLLLLLVGAIGQARRRVAIMTPYFVPPRELLGALKAAALRGIEVTVLLPANNNLFFVHRATRHLLWELLERGVRVFYQPGHFVHSKLLLIDDDYAQVGSANLDPRSLRLNFELNLEVYDADFLAALDAHFRVALGRARETTLAEVDGRPLPTRLIDGTLWLFSPYL